MEHLGEARHQAREDGEPGEGEREPEPQPHLRRPVAQLAEAVQGVGEEEEREDGGQREDDTGRIPQREDAWALLGLLAAASLYRRGAPGRERFFGRPGLPARALAW
jgi:hypothetical protein